MSVESLTIRTCCARRQTANSRSSGFEVAMAVPAAPLRHWTPRRGPRASRARGDEGAAVKIRTKPHDVLRSRYVSEFTRRAASTGRATRGHRLRRHATARRAARVVARAGGLWLLASRGGGRSVLHARRRPQAVPCRSAHTSCAPDVRRNTTSSWGWSRPWWTSRT